MHTIIYIDIASSFDCKIHHCPSLYGLNKNHVGAFQVKEGVSVPKTPKISGPFY